MQSLKINFEIDINILQTYVLYLCREQLVDKLLDFNNMQTNSIKEFKWQLKQICNLVDDDL
jgi:hypothetical protein